MQGWRITQEDAHIIHEVTLDGGAKGLIAGVFDGHGGEEVSKFAAENFEKIFMAQLKAASSPGNIAEVLINTFMVLDKQVEGYDFSDSQGCTACVVLITETKIYCANSGDSRSILVRGKAGAIALSKDHKPSLPQELQRI